MKRKNKARYVLAAICFFVLLAGIEVGKAGAATYYASPSGSGTTCSSASPCSLTTGLGKVTAGDTLHLKDGTYTQSLSVTKSGTSSAYITIKAQNDGQAIIDGQGVRRPCYIKGPSYLNVEGLVCKNSNSNVFEISNSNHINIRRVSAYSVLVQGNYHAFPINYSNDILLEDCAASGTARVLYNLQSSQRVTLRRCWGRYTASARPEGPYVGVQVYGSDDSVVENSVLTRGSGSSVYGINLWANTYNASTDRNRIYGNIAYNFDGSGFYINASGTLSNGSQRGNIHDNEWKNNVGISNGGHGFYDRADDNLIIENLTIAGTTADAYRLDATSGLIGTLANLTNSSFYTSGYGLHRIDSTLNHSYNNFYQNASGNYSGTSAGTGEWNLNPGYNIGAYGKGAYLMVPSALQGRGKGGADIGAEVLYRYEDGVLTNVPLWPWPMEDRIKAETGYSVTWESAGGLWKTLDGVYGINPVIKNETGY